MSALAPRAILTMALITLPMARAQEPGTPDPLRASYRAECAACHLAYPPELLPAASWERLMARLPRHFGADASLDPDTLHPLTTWLAAHAARPDRHGSAPPEDRITRSGWFVREHDELPSSVWRGASVRSASNCAACHAGAEQGIFDEHDVHIPR